MTISIRRPIRADVLALLAPLAIGALGTIPTARAIPTWYRALDKPGWNPPDRIFGPVWTTLYALMGIALVLVRRQSQAPEPVTEGAESTAQAVPEPANPSRVRAQTVFGLQLALNLAWSFVFFGGRSLRGGVVVITLLWASIVATIAEFSRTSRVAALLLVPYLAWVSFASILNIEIARRNS
jgi:translocator protein